MQKILFVCHGNICRSPMAEFVMKDLVKKSRLENAIYISSAATSTEELGNDIHPGTRKILLQKNIPFEKRHARQITKADYEEYGYIVVMDENNIRNLRRIIGEDRDKKVFRLLDFTDRAGDSIADPWYTGNFVLTYEDVLYGCNGLLEFLRKRI